MPDSFNGCRSTHASERVTHLLETELEVRAVGCCISVPVWLSHQVPYWWHQVRPKSLAAGQGNPSSISCKSHLVVVENLTLLQGLA